MEERICGLIVAAGLSSRMGCFKPLLPLRGKTVIEKEIVTIVFQWRVGYRYIKVSGKHPVGKAFRLGIRQFQLQWRMA